MSDIVEQLRAAGLRGQALCNEARDEIERLRDEIEQLKMRVAEAEQQVRMFENA